MVAGHHCFTLKFTGRANILHTPIAISAPSLGPILPKYQTRGLWDTGCSVTTITQKVVDALGLIATGVTRVNTASETNKPTETFQIDLFLSDELVFKNLTVNLGKILDGIDCLLGMDIIGTGDFTISNLGGNTCMSFRHPSSHEIDFSKTPTMGIENNPIVGGKTPGRNDPCPCGSGKKYKYCHGKA